MGVLSSNLKPSFLGLLKFLNNMNWFIVFFSLINFSMCIYEDQIGKFDWRQTYVGRIKFAQFDTVSTAKKIIVATEENVLAALNLKTGQVVWRHVFETASAGNIQLLHVGEKVTTVTGSNPYLVRGWDTATGILMWEWSLTLQDDNMAEYSEWWVQNNMLVHMLPVFGSHVEVTLYNLVTGNNRGATSKLPAIWTNEGCVLSAPYYICVSGERGSRLIISMDVTSDAVQILTKSLSNYIQNEKSYGGHLKSLNGNSVVPGFIVDDKILIVIKENDYEKVNVELNKESSATVIDGAFGSILVQASNDNVKGFTLLAHLAATGEQIPDIQTGDPSLEIPEPELLAVMCTRNAKEQHACRLLVNAADDAVHLMQQGGRVLWTREEALANVVVAEFVDLPVSDMEAALESEFDQKEGSIWSAFSRRLHTQYQQLLNLIKSLQGESAVEETSPLVRDYFNLHKIIVLVTDAGKIFGIDNLSGEILWQKYDPNLNPENAVIFTRRSARHAPYDAYLSIVGKHEETGNGYIISLNPIRGALSGEGTLHLDTRLLQVAILHVRDAESLHALVVLDEDENVQVLPYTAQPLVHNFYMYVANKETGKVNGYALRYNGKEVVAQRTWSLRLGGRVAAAARARPERVRAPGRALADRTVLYKYSNPNLVLFLVDSDDPTHKETLTAVVVDAVSGALAGAAWHRRARALPLAVHADNCFAYLYRSEKHRRVELATIELYEGASRWQAAGAAFSSLGAEARAPAVERQAFILPAAPTAAALTATRRSLADRHLLLALSKGAIIELPWAYIEARRGVGMGEEGQLPYTPELPLPSEATVNYNLTVQRAARVYTAPAALESTSLVLVTGLDLFYTRVAPSKTFDLLKDDFDYYLIVLVLGALIAATYSSKYFASRKMLKMAWK